MKKGIIQSETRFWMEGDKVCRREVDLDEVSADLNPHPTETRVVLINGKGKTIFSQELQKNRIVDIEFARQVALCSIKMYDFNHSII